MPKITAVWTLAGLSLCLVAEPAAADPGFAEAPGAPVLREPPRSHDEPPSEPPQPELDESPPTSNARVSVGPGLRLAEAAADGGLVAALDLGSGAVGARASGTWVRVGSAQGLSEYGADLWIDFGAGRRLHPIVGAGAAVARLNEVTATGERAAWTYGAGVLRGTLEYVLPVEHADARAGLDAVGSVTAIQARSAPDVGPWLVLTARVGIGF